MTAMRKVLVLRHIDGDALARFGDFFAADGLAIHAVDLHRGATIPDPGGFDLMLAMGGAMQVWQEDDHPWLAAEKEAIRDWVIARRKPYLGICLGHQLLATALGGEAAMAREPEVGLGAITLNDAGLGHPLLAGLGSEQPVMQWHYAEVTKLPREAVSLASSDITEHQIIAVGKHALSMQFHCEWTTDFIRSWMAMPSWRQALEDDHGPGAIDRMVAAARPRMPQMHRSTGVIYNNFKLLNRF